MSEFSQLNGFAELQLIMWSIDLICAQLIIVELILWADDQTEKGLG